MSKGDLKHRAQAMLQRVNQTRGRLETDREWYLLKAAGVFWFDELRDGKPIGLIAAPRTLFGLPDSAGPDEMAQNLLAVLREICEEMDRPDWAGTWADSWKRAVAE
jgi:hypothetical protein